MKPVKKLVLVCLVFVFCACMAGCNQEKTLKIGLLNIDDSVPFFVAQKEGLFEKHGVSVELLPFNSGQAQATAVEAGELDGMMTDMIVQGLLKKGGTDMKTVAIALGAVPEEGRFLVVSSPQSGIQVPSDLLGAKVAISTNTMMDFLFEQFEGLEHLDKDTITKVNMPNLMLRVEALLQGKDIQAAILPDPLAAYAVMSGAHVVIDDTMFDVNLSQSVVAMTQTAIDEKRPEVEKMLAAYWEAMTLLNEHPDEYRDFSLQVANVPAELAQTYPFVTYTPKAIPDEEGVSRVVDWLVARKLIPAPYGYEEMVDTGFIQ